MITEGKLLKSFEDSRFGTPYIRKVPKLNEQGDDVEGEWEIVIDGTFDLAKLLKLLNE